MAAGRGARRRVSAVVLGASDGIREDDPGLVDAAHARRGLVGALVEVRMVALRQAPMGAGDLQRGGIAVDAKDRVGIEGGAASHRRRF